MCGVIGYVGHRRADVRVVAALERLEYRGYDSPGICLHTPGGLELAGEMKHGPIALDEQTPVVGVATTSPVLDKLRSNLAEVRARGVHAIAHRRGLDVDQPRNLARTVTVE